MRFVGDTHMFFKTRRFYSNIHIGIEFLIIKHSLYLLVASRTSWMILGVTPSPAGARSAKKLIDKLFYIAWPFCVFFLILLRHFNSVLHVELLVAIMFADSPICHEKSQKVTVV